MTFLWQGKVCLDYKHGLYVHFKTLKAVVFKKIFKLKFFIQQVNIKWIKFWLWELTVLRISFKNQACHLLNSIFCLVVCMLKYISLYKIAVGLLKTKYIK